MPNQQYRRSERHESNGNPYDKYGTWSDRIGLIVSIIVAFFTLLLFYQTKTSTDAAVRSANDADSAIAQQRINDKTSEYNDSIRSRNDSIHYEKNFELQRRSIQAQIDQLNEAQQEFAKESRAFAQVADIRLSVDTFNKVNPEAAISFNIVDIGKSPAKIIKGYYNASFNIIDTSMSAKMNENVYISPDVHAPKMLNVGIDNIEHALSVLNGNAKVYLFGEYTYLSTMTNTKYRTSFVYVLQMHQNSKLDIAIEKNEDKQVFF